MSGNRGTQRLQKHPSGVVFATTVSSRSWMTMRMKVIPSFSTMTLLTNPPCTGYRLPVLSSTSSTRSRGEYPCLISDLQVANRHHSTRVQQLRNDHAVRRARIVADAPNQLQQANFARRSFREKQMALNLAQFASTNKDLTLGNDQVENLVGTLIVSCTP